MNARVLLENRATCIQISLHIKFTFHHYKYIPDLWHPMVLRAEIKEVVFPQLNPPVAITVGQNS